MYVYVGIYIYLFIYKQINILHIFKPHMKSILIKI